uniref:Uncharacterized protein n=1 Tax=Anguilla anguilla TaxID=7936 RepID=A0A0E9VBV0_ANGAN
MIFVSSSALRHLIRLDTPAIDVPFMVRLMVEILLYKISYS